MTASLLLFNCTLPAQEKRALVIGIGEYRDSSWGDICGDEDLYYVEEMLDQYGFTHRVVLENSQATKSAISNGFADLERQCAEGDVIYIHFSGHGQQMTDVDGDEDDGWDESWVPYDGYYQYCPEDRGQNHMSDDEINSWLHRIRRKIGDSGKIMVVVDACHSGGSSRSMAEVYAKDAVRGASTRFIIPGIQKKYSSSLRKEEWIILTACKSFQNNYEVREPRVGKLTYCLYLLRSRLTRFSNEELLEAISRNMSELPEMISPLPQSPTLADGGVDYAIRDIFTKVHKK